MNERIDTPDSNVPFLTVPTNNFGWIAEFVRVTRVAAFDQSNVKDNGANVLVSWFAIKTPLVVWKDNEHTVE